MAARGGGRILEVGFGMGISASFLSEHGALQHIVAEPNRQVFNTSMQHARSVSSRTAFSPVLGFWQEVTPLLRSGSFDGVLFDAFPDAADVQFFREARRLLRPGGVLTFYHSVCDDLGHELTAAECKSWEDVTAELRAAGWAAGEVPPGKPKAIVLPIDNTCPSHVLAGTCGSRPRTFVSPAITRADDGVRVTAKVEPAVDRAALAAVQLATHGHALPTRTEFQEFPITDLRTGATEAGVTGAVAVGANGEAMSLVINNAVVMDTEETENMIELAQIATSSHDAPSQRHGRLLEVGYGLGISARAIQRQGVREHVLIEANIDVMRTLLASEVGGLPGVRPILGFWQEILPTLDDELFDSIFFDPFPNDDEAGSERVIHQRGFMKHAYRVLAPGGVFVYMSGDAEPGDITADTTAALEAGFAPADVSITAKEYEMLDVCPEYPKCETRQIAVQLTRLTKPGASGTGDATMGTATDPSGRGTSHVTDARCTSAVSDAVQDGLLDAGAAAAQELPVQRSHERGVACTFPDVRGYLEAQLARMRSDKPLFAGGPTLRHQHLHDILREREWNKIESDLPRFELLGPDVARAANAGVPFVVNVSRVAEFVALQAKLPLKPRPGSLVTVRLHDEVLNFTDSPVGVVPYRIVQQEVDDGFSEGAYVVHSSYDDGELRALRAAFGHPNLAVRGCNAHVDAIGVACPPPEQGTLGARLFRNGSCGRRMRPRSRLGFGSLTVETHYDLEPNFLWQRRGAKRVILFHPLQEAELPYPHEHPFGHCISAPLSALVQATPHLRASVHVLRPGELLHIPALWWHNIEVADASHAPSRSARSTARSSAAADRPLAEPRLWATLNHIRHCRLDLPEWHPIVRLRRLMLTSDEPWLDALALRSFPRAFRAVSRADARLMGVDEAGHLPCYRAGVP